MNLPNKLTVLRMLIVPVFFCVLLWCQGVAGRLFAALLFIAASITDYFDGHIARRDNLITNFGKLMDPIADKVLVMAALVVLTYLGRIHPLVAFITFGREFLISGIRLVAAGTGNIVAAGQLGKIKTVTQMVAIPILIVFTGGFFGFIGQLVMWVSVIFSILSCVEYIFENLYVFSQK